MWDIISLHNNLLYYILKKLGNTVNGVLIGALVKIAAHTRAKKIVYISCKPTSLVRDLVELQKYGYKMIRARSVDMFPNTGQIETVCELALVEDQQNNQQNDQ